MATRIVEGKKPYTGGKAITVDENKVISLNLRDENNLIIYDAGDDEIYVDLQLPDGIKPVDAFPVGITTGRVLVADDRDVTGTLICAKTTSGDNIKILYGDNNKLYMDNGTGTFRQVYFADEVDAIIQLIWNYLDENLNTKTFRLANRTDLEMGQDILDRYNNGGNPIIMYSNRCYFLLKKEGSYLRFRSSYFQSSENPNESDTNILVSDLDLNFNEYDEIISIIDISGDSLGLRPYLATNKDYGQNVYQPLYDGSPATKKYVDDAVSTMVGSVYKYKGSVLSYEDLPNAQSVNPPQEGDVWNVEQAHATTPEFPAGTNVAWTGTAWDPLSGMIDLSAYYTSTQVNTLLAGKQDTLSTQTAYTNKGSATKVPQISTNTLGQVTGITEVDITVGDSIEYKTQAEYNALLPGALTDNKHYFIYDTGASPRLPSAYQEVEYIQTTGGQYIDTGYIPQSGDTAEIKFNFLTQTGDEQWITAIWQSPYGYRAGAENHGSSWKTNNGFSYDTTGLNTDIIAIGSCTHTFSKNSYLFAQNENNTPYHLNKGTMRLYYCTLSRSGTPVRDFVPCYRKTDTEIGLYDLVNDVFYTNSGTGTFIKGPDVN